MNRLRHLIFICIITLLLTCSCLFAADKEYTSDSKSPLKFSAKFPSRPSAKPLVRNKNRNSKYNVSFALFIFMYMVGSFVIWYKDKTKVNKVEQQANDPQQMQSILNQFMSLNITPVEYNKLLNEFCTNMNDFRLILLELLRRMVISIDENYLHIDLAKLNTLKDYEREFIDILFNVMPFQQQNQTKSVLLSQFLNILISENQEISRLMNQVFITISQNIDLTLKGEATTLSVYLKQRSAKFTSSTFDIFKYYENNQSIDLMVLYYLASFPTVSNTSALSRFKPVENVTVHVFYYTLGCFLDASAANYVPAPVGSGFGGGCGGGCGGGGCSGGCGGGGCGGGGCGGGGCGGGGCGGGGCGGGGAD